MKSIKNIIITNIVLMLIAASSFADPGFASSFSGFINLATDLEPIRASHSFPALSAAVIVDGKTSCCRCDWCPVNMEPVSKRKSMIRFHLGSCTKAMTAFVNLPAYSGRQIKMGDHPGRVFSGVERKPCIRITAK